MMSGSLFSIGQIAAMLKVPPWRVLYIVSTRRIQPCARVGHCRVFDQCAVNRIRGELARIDRKRSEGGE